MYVFALSLVGTGRKDAYESYSVRQNAFLLHLPKHLKRHLGLSELGKSSNNDIGQENISWVQGVKQHASILQGSTEGISLEKKGTKKNVLVESFVDKEVMDMACIR